jgi:hypothetical protein
MKRIITTLIIAVGLAGPLLVIPGAASADVGVVISADFGPPPLLYYPQPLCPGVGFIWTPGYWAYSDEGYFWVPGTWVLAPAIGLLWTPGWWGWHEGRYWWHGGYWGRHVGYYGGIHYGYGYPGQGYRGGYWRDHDFYYNRAVSNIDQRVIHNTYSQPVNDGGSRTNRVSYNGGTGGITSKPSAAQQKFAREQHFSDTEAQLEQESIAMHDPAQRWAVNHGRPQVAATARPGEFNSAGAVKLNQQQSVHRDTPVAHATPGQPSFQRTQRTEAVPVFKPAEPRTQVRQQPAQVTMPEQNGFRSEPRVQQPQPEPVRVEKPRIREPATEVQRESRRAVKVAKENHHKNKGGRPPR